ncbi:MAG TPA: family 16 glycoside hydrolase, partial [Planctomycetota bacterium]|nr:family 16 glycoside hydrolase [Planctomycetota bacterium]
MKKTIWIAAALVLTAGLTVWATTQDKKKPGYQDTPLIPGQKWKVHDSERPVPAVVTPGSQPGAPPSDAVVLFDGKDLSKWKGPKGEAHWKVVDGYIEETKGGDIQTIDSWGDFQLHIEWASPAEVKSESQGR